MRTLIPLLASVTLVACAAEAPPASETPAAPPPGAPARRQTGPALLTVPNAEASPRATLPPAGHDPRPLRSDGKRHALERTKEGVVLMSETDGVLGLLRGPGDGTVAWAGFVDDDAVLVASQGSIFRAGSPADALAGRFEGVGPLPRWMEWMASAGSWVVASTTEPDAPLAVSKDGGKSFALVTRPPGILIALTVRSDGAIVIAIEGDSITGQYNEWGRRTQVHVKKGGAWAKGPLADAFFLRVVDHYGDAITVEARTKLDDPKSSRTLGLAAGGAWVPARTESSWPTLSLAQDYFYTSTPTKRPGFVVPPAADRFGIMGGLMGGERCSGTGCLGRRHPASAPLRVQAFLDGECAPSDVKIKKETVHLEEPNAPARDVPRSFPVCADEAPARRGSALLLGDGASARLGRLPTWCAEGRLVGSGREVYTVCSGKHRGRPSIHHVGADGALAEVAAPVAPDLEVLGAESASDGTTVLFAAGAAFLCRAAERCEAVRHDRFLAARPLPGRRLLVARAAADEHGLELAVEGGAASPSVHVAPTGNVVDLEVTADGHVRIWTSATLTELSPPGWLAKSRANPDVDAFLVAAGGELVPDADGKAALLRAIDALRRGK